MRERGPDGAAMQLARKRDLPGERRAGGGGEGRLDPGLVDEGAGAGAEGRTHAATEQRGGDHHDACAVERLGELSHGGEARRSRRVTGEDDGVRPAGPDLLE